ncbi:MAG: glucose-6-phosphate dehydrogenase [Actinomycetota bacterium]
MTQHMPEPCTLVIFGATGDLSARKLMPSLYRMYVAGSIPTQISIVGAGRKPMPDEDFRTAIRDAVEKHATGPLEGWDAFSERLRYVCANPGEDPSALRSAVGAGNRLFYLATPPSAYEGIVEWLGENDLHHAAQGWSRLIVEKPFGRDRASAEALTASIHRFFPETSLFRIDHYLGKETVQNLFVFRFANGIFEPVWNRRYVDSVQITVAEEIGVESRGAYYEEAGAVRDMVQNHLLQLVTLTAMEPPVEFSAGAIRDEKVKVLHALAHGGITRSVRGQYVGYRQEKAVDPNSRRETFIALELFADNWRWAGVPWLLRTGKKMPARVTEIAIHFKQAPFLPFASTAISELKPNVLSLRIQPNEGIQLCFGAKAPGGMEVRNVNMDFDYDETFGTSPPESYERLLLDAMLGDATLFTRADEVSIQWQIVDSLLDSELDPYPYFEGRWGPAEANRVAEPRAWRRL